MSRLLRVWSLLNVVELLGVGDEPEGTGVIVGTGAGTKVNKILVYLINIRPAWFICERYCPSFF